MNFVFEDFNVSSMAFGLDSINALYSSGKKSGIVVDSGDSFTRIIPILEGHVD